MNSMATKLTLIIISTIFIMDKKLIQNLHASEGLN